MGQKTNTKVWGALRMEHRRAHPWGRGEGGKGVKGVRNSSKEAGGAVPAAGGAGQASEQPGPGQAPRPATPRPCAPRPGPATQKAAHTCPTGWDALRGPRCPPLLRRRVRRPRARKPLRPAASRHRRPLLPPGIRRAG